jgi:endonuclease/exonuclease/phosphatase family metal-dependent hydrolase
MAPLKLVSLNVEGNRHVERVFSFLEKTDADVICLQEVFETEFRLLRRVLRMHGMFAPVTRIGEKEYKNVSGTPGIEGVGLLTRLPFRELSQHYYLGAHHPIPEYKDRDMNTINRVLVTATVTRDGADYIVGTTHFTWTPDGKANDDQRRDIKSLLKILAGIPEIILVGDFNAPRGREIWGMLASLYKDNIPADVDTTIEANLSRHGDLRLVVDGCFTTPHFKAVRVDLIQNISDHWAVRAELIRVK